MGTKCGTTALPLISTSSASKKPIDLQTWPMAPFEGFRSRWNYSDLFPSWSRHVDLQNSGQTDQQPLLSKVPFMSSQMQLPTQLLRPALGRLTWLGPGQSKSREGVRTSAILTTARPCVCAVSFGCKPSCARFVWQEAQIR